MSFLRSIAATLFLLVIPAIASAQATAAPPRNVVSLNPLAIIFGLYGAEYERAVGRTTTLGALASHWSTDTHTSFGRNDVSYTSMELKGRIYPNARIFQGFSFGVTTGVVALREDIGFFGTAERNTATALSIGFEMAYSWLLGEEDNFYVGTGVGAKRLGVVAGEIRDASLAYPTLRLSVGYAF
jgi:hypothetical protein